MPPREKYKKYGIDALTDSDLVGLLIGSGQKGYSYSDISSNVVKKLSMDAKKDDFDIYHSLIGIVGVGPIVALKILAGIELGRRTMNVKDNTKWIINKSSDSLKHLDDIRSRKRECVKGLFLNARFELIHKEILTIGSVNKTEILPRDILIPAMEHGSAYLVIAHNHPSNNPEPSSADVLHTKRIADACKLVGVRMLEHLIICPNGSWSSIPF